MINITHVANAHAHAKKIAKFAKHELCGRLNEITVDASLDAYVGREPQFDLTAVAHAIRDLRGQLDELAALLELEE